MVRDEHFKPKNIRASWEGMVSRAEDGERRVVLEDAAAGNAASLYPSFELEASSLSR